MTAVEWLVVVLGIAAIAAVNWWFFLAGDREQATHVHEHHH